MLALTATLLSATTAHAWPAPPAHRAACDSRPVPALCKVHWWVRATHRAEQARGLARSRYWYSAERHPNQAPWLEQRKAWRFRAQRITAIRLHPWTAAWFADILCIHHYEGPWNDPDAPYWGGLQEDLPFQEAYGPEFYRRWGTADHWPPVDQITAAWRAYQSRGFTPWPNTAAMCGLL